MYISQQTLYAIRVSEVFEGYFSYRSLSRLIMTQFRNPLRHIPSDVKCHIVSVFVYYRRERYKGLLKF